MRVQADSPTADVLVIGAGVVGLAIAWRAAQRGLRVTLADPSPGQGATHVAAGMLAPLAEASYAERELFRLGIESLRRYPGFAAELTELTGLPTGLRQTGTLQVAYLIVALRAVGLDTGPMTGFDTAKADAEFFPDGRFKSNVLINIGYGDRDKLFPRSPRFSFDEIAKIV